MKKNNLKIVKIDKNKSLFNYEKKILINDLVLDLKLGYYDFEREKLRRVLDWVDEPLDDIQWLMKMRRDFVLFIDEFDKRRGKNFIETFPEMDDFYYSCKKLL